MTEEARASSFRRFGPALPFLIFAVLAGLFWYALQSGDPSLLPSPLIGKKVPDFTLPSLEGLSAEGNQVPGFASSDLASGEPAQMMADSPIATAPERSVAALSTMVTFRPCFLAQ